MNRRVLIDLTDIERWSGIHGGIQRVVYGISKALFEADSADFELGFISFDAAEKKFFKSSFEPIYHRVENIGEVREGEYNEVAISRASTLKAYAKRYIPNRILSTKLARRAARSIAGIDDKKQVPEKDWVMFTEHDTALILGMPWENLEIQRVLAAERSRTHMTLVQVVYDLVICLYPHLHHPANIQPYTENMLAALKNSDILLPISKSSANDLELFAKMHGRKVPRLKIIRLGDTIAAGNKSPIKARKPHVTIAQDFIACVGTVEIRKNHTLLYYTYKLAAERGVELPQLVIVGGSGWFSGDIQHLINNDPAMKDKVIILNNVTDEGLAWIYQHCLYTVYPSMYEGWGLPIAESLSYGKLCLSSNTSSMPEIAAELIDYFSPYSPEECLNKIHKYYAKAPRIKKEKEIKQTYRSTSWEQTATEVASYLKAYYEDAK